MKLRDYQIKCIKQIKESYIKGHNSPCLVLPCGGGKSNIMAHIAKTTTEKGGFVLLILHRQELKQQMTETFKEWNVSENMFYIGMVQSMKRKLDKLPIPRLIIVEEGHHGTANTYQNVFNFFSETKKVFFTATPTRLNGGGLGDVCDDLIIGVSAKWLIANKFLAPYQYFSVPVADFTGVTITRGDYDLKKLAEVMENNHIYGDAVKTYKQKALGKKTIIYCSSVKASKETAKEFKRAGFKAESLDGKTNINDRLKVMNQFRSGEIDILTNFALFGEGIDVPSCDCVILLRKTKSLTLFIQMSMRCMRINPQNLAKKAIIIDHCGNVFEHGFPDDDRIWTLETKKKSENEDQIQVKTCENCFSVLMRDALICPICGMDFTEEVKERKEAERVEAELVELKRLNDEQLKSIPYRDIDKMKTWSELDAVRQARGYKIVWAVRKALQLKIPIPPKYKSLEGLVR